MLMGLLRTMRPRQWPKNIFIFPALVFDRQLSNPEALARTVAGFVLLCLASSVIYIFNDVADLEADRNHPTKRNRPIAAGSLPVPAALAVGSVMGLFTLISSFALKYEFGLIVLAYTLLNLAYSWRLKHVPIIDILIIASGFVLRVRAGVDLITVERFSPWLYVCTSLLALFIGFGKRRSEMVLLAEDANRHRRVLDGYTITFLDQLIVIVSATTIIAYSLYTFSAENLPDNHLMMLTIPFVMYCLFRYLYLIHVENLGGAPEELVLTDRPLAASFILWALAVAAILYLTP